MSCDPRPPNEHRDRRRQRTLLTGVGCYLDGTATFECSFRDLSDSGGRIRFSSSLIIPMSFHLVNVRDRVAYKAEVAWRKVGEAGLRWRSVTSLEGTVDPHNAHLKMYLSEKTAR